MRTYFLIPVACLAGVLIGSWGPRNEIREMKRIADEKTTAKNERPKNVAAEGFMTFAKLANIPDRAKHPRRHKAKSGKPLFAGATNVVPVQVDAPAPTNASVRTAEKRKRVPAADFRARIEEAQELWRTRVEIARANWKKKLKITSENEASFNAALDEMNEQLYDTMSSFSQMLAEKNKVTTELGLRFAGDMMTIMSETYEKVGACTMPDLRETVSEMSMADFIDPGVAEPLVNVQNILERFPEGE